MTRLSYRYDCSTTRLCPWNAGADAGQAFEKLAQTHLKLDSRLEAASSYVEAAKCYQKTNKAGRSWHSDWHDAVSSMS